MIVNPRCCSFVYKDVLVDIDQVLVVGWYAKEKLFDITALCIVGRKDLYYSEP